MAKINLITRHSGESYGAILQTYATCEILKSLGHNVTIINLVESDRVRKYFEIKNILSYPKFINFWLFKIHYYPKRTVLMTSINRRCIPKADYTIVGSDQVWNEDVTKGNRLAYFLNFADDTNKLSLASSFGKFKWEGAKEYTEEVKKCLHDFKAVSVRETSGVDICKNVFDINAKCIIDPTIAWGKYENIVKEKQVNHIVCFALKPNNPLVIQIVEALEKKTSVKTLFLDYCSNSKYYRLKMIQKSPKRWLNELFNAPYVITDSFHGVAFSLIFKKQFFVVCADAKKFTRINSLLDKVGLTNRVIPDIEYFNNNIEYLLNAIDYKRVDETLLKERENYYDFLHTNLI